jgi:ABC-2 type transport system ATP-binding protein
MGHSVVREPAAVRGLLGVVPQDIALYADLSARENLAFWGRMYGLGGAELAARVDRVLEDVGLADRQKGPISRFSGGMKRRLNLAVALVHRPPVVYLDEPTVGVDPQSRRSILDGIMALRDEGVTVLYTTHYMEEAQEISDVIAIMDRGEIIATGSQAELVRLVGEEDRIRVTVSGENETQAEALAAAWRQMSGVAAVVVDEGENEGLTLLARDGNRTLPRLFEMAVVQGARITSVEVRAPNLETVFLHLTGRALRD